jgi:hypothetical protein
MIKQAWIVVPLLFLLNACEKDFVIKDQASSSKMVVNSLFSNSGKMNVYVTGSYASNGANTIHSLEDATVELYEENVFKEQLKYVLSDTAGTFGKFQSSFNPVKGKKYSISVTQAQYGQVSATDEQVIPVQILNYYVAHYPADSTENSRAKMVINMHDNGDKENYYRITMWAEEKLSQVINAQGDTMIYTRTQSYKLMPAIYLADTAREWGWNLFFSDNGFNGQNKTLEFDFQDATTKDKLISSKLWYEIRTISKAYYLYNKTLELYRQTNNTNSSEPSYVYTNIANGYGIFASYNAQSKSTIIK